MCIIFFSDDFMDFYGFMDFFMDFMDFMDSEIVHKIH